ncbi:hypothetical protein B5X24_HaOG204627 [Helicoverpa armigera]|nr:hypothetical protein B5X24_HaOG204627 [Helicoverpa armigera]
MVFMDERLRVVTISHVLERRYAASVICYVLIRLTYQLIGRAANAHLFTDLYLQLFTVRVPTKLYIGNRLERTENNTNAD